MKFRTTLILLVLVIACAAYLFYVDRYKPSTEELKRVEKRVFRDFEPAQVVRILLDVTQRDSETGAVTGTQNFELDRDSAGWNLLKPVNFPADETLVRQVLDLTTRERQIVMHLGEGRTSKEIARTLAISPRTVEAYRARLMKKFGAGNVAELLSHLSTVPQ